MTTAEPTSLLSGRVALVVGASRGIGATIAATLAGAGAQVVLAARNAADLDRQVSAIAESSGRPGSAVAMPVDVTREDSVKSLLDGIRDRFGRLDAAVNNAAGGGRTPAPLADWDSEEFDTAISANLRG
ncbi:MAG TPA: SDR family NAD(P)-dependent oxidoreductase, partial [Arthrobacter sp.]|nr:SDR family NAD(P)-dependent oxidoreductase [Arthrobacter sp.]